MPPSRYVVERQKADNIYSVRIECLITERKRRFAGNLPGITRLNAGCALGCIYFGSDGSWFEYLGGKRRDLR